jgi:hypothetical protein
MPPTERIQEVFLLNSAATGRFEVPGACLAFHTLKLTPPSLLLIIFQPSLTWKEGKNTAI